MFLMSKFFSPKVSISGSAGADIAVQRMTLARDFYMKSGFSNDKALNHMRGIDFSKPVQTTTLKKVRYYSNGLVKTVWAIILRP